MGLILHNAGLADNPVDFYYADAEVTVALLLTTTYSTSLSQENSSQQPIPSNGFHSTKTASL